MKLIRSIPIEKLTLFAILIVGSFYLFVLPPNSAPDEADHFRSAYQNADVVLNQTSDDIASVAMRKADGKMVSEYSNFPDRYTYEFFSDELFKPLADEDKAIVDVKRSSGVPHPYIYFPQTLGILLGRAIQTNGEWLYLFGRIFNLIFYAVCIWLTVKLAPIGKGAFALAALWPMSIELAASLNSDVYTIALTFLAIAQYLRIAYADSPARLRDLLLLSLTMALLGPPKVVFIPLMMLAFFLPGRCFATRRIAILYRILVVIVFFATVWVALYVYMHRADGGIPVVTLPGDPTLYTFADLAADPLLFAKMCYRTIRLLFEFYLNSMVGAELGHLEISVNKIVIEIFLALAVVGAFRASSTEKTLLVRDRIEYIGIFLITALGTAVIMFVSWTTVGSWNISGIQGRYFLPAFPLVLFCAARWKKPVRPSWLCDKNLVLAACALHVFVLISAYLFISGRDPIVLQ